MKRPLSLVALAALTACAIAPLQPDLGAKAPRLDGFGSSDARITTRSDEAQRLFRAGLLQAYAFNEKEAVRQFKAALAADPGCAMCAWGVAWQLGPIINAPQRGDLTEARQYVDHAVRQAQGATARERALIDAMAVRYDVAPRAGSTYMPSEADLCRGTRGNAKANALDVAYAERLHALVMAYPDDADILTLWSEAAMVAATDDWYDEATGKPLPRIAEMVDRLEALLKQHPNHTGLNHYMIHAADAAPAAARAVAAADRLASLAPNSPHLVHMPAHIFVRVGRYGDAAAVNERAVAADDAQDAKLKEQGFAITSDWRGHNTQFLWYAALTQGRGEAAIAAARAMAARAKADRFTAEYFRSLPLLTLMRLERWDAALAEPLASGDKGMATALGEQVHGTAQARRGKIAEAKQALARAESGAEKVKKGVTGDDDFARMLRDIADAAVSRLRAEIALGERRGDDALAEQARSVSASKSADSREPPFLGAGARVSLGDMQLQLGRAVAAEATYRADLALQPDSGWALQGLARALAAQGKAAEAAEVRGRAERAWAQADAALKARS
ncbi:MAG TPA: hypothetical protein VFQ16_03675 [Burkholderiaceae bacterium]|nr:hypothetical protein [Burkholderiaceae bacterium]